MDAGWRLLSYIHTECKDSLHTLSVGGWSNSILAGGNVKVIVCTCTCTIINSQHSDIFLLLPAFFLSIPLYHLLKVWLRGEGKRTVAIISEFKGSVNMLSTAVGRHDAFRRVPCYPAHSFLVMIEETEEDIETLIDDWLMTSTYSCWIGGTEAPIWARSWSTIGTPRCSPDRISERVVKFKAWTTPKLLKFQDSYNFMNRESCKRKRVFSSLCLFWLDYIGVKIWIWVIFSHWALDASNDLLNEKTPEVTKQLHQPPNWSVLLCLHNYCVSITPPPPKPRIIGAYKSKLGLVQCKQPGMMRALLIIWMVDRWCAPQCQTWGAFSRKTFLKSRISSMSAVVISHAVCRFSLQKCVSSEGLS